MIPGILALGQPQNGHKLLSNSAPRQSFNQPPANTAPTFGQALPRTGFEFFVTYDQAGNHVRVQ